MMCVRVCVYELHVCRACHQMAGEFFVACAQPTLLFRSPCCCTLAARAVTAVRVSSLSSKAELSVEACCNVSSAAYWKLRRSKDVATKRIEHAEGEGFVAECGLCRHRWLLVNRRGVIGIFVNYSFRVFTARRLLN